MRRRSLLFATVAALAPLPALADGVALVMGTGTYESLPDLARGAEVAEAVDGLAPPGLRGHRPGRRARR
ncbi:hypothetical protein Rumeso_04035 [Rubellimicrobium mesophilum DSM 19309]|uniref:Uncharacterized protein n=1 Tax=Rubellimicrobium mesophilum DSM 19309 TaxID=442562 RepID=A0A017HJ43_9RHOB|nr:hypothetical protein [Rubellimicrobium mesophilum]EYD74350.1 hypothetical protein Rumeso_04035 [Rubellimicrobium mesophilum DSM 19309]